MATCKDCIHFGICKKGFPWADGKGGGWCEDFKDKASFVEIVRCKDCKHYVARYCTRDINGRTNMFLMNENDFCSYGERRTE